MNNFIRYFLISISIIAQLQFAFAQTASILPQAETQFLDNNGKPVTSGTVDFYIPGSTTRKTTWQDADRTIANDNPVVLNGSGRAIVYGYGGYRQVLKDRIGNLIWDRVTNSYSIPNGQVTSGDGDAVATVKAWGGLVAPNQYVFAYGQEISRVTFPEFFSAVTLTQNVNCTSGSNVLSGIADTSQTPIGAAIEVSCVAGTVTVTSKTSTSYTVSANAIANTTVSAVVFPFGNGNGTTTLNVPDFRGRVLAGRDNMGGIAASRLTSTYFANASAIGATGGSQSNTLLTVNLPPYTPAGSVALSLSGTVPLSGGSQYTGGATATAVNPGGSVAVSFAGSTASFTGTAQGGTSTPFGVVQPSMTVNYIIKITPDQTGLSASGVQSIQGMSGAIICDSPITCSSQHIGLSGIGTGTVTSVALTTPSILSVSGSPVTTSGTLAMSLANQTANKVFAGPTAGGAVTPTFRSLVVADLPPASSSLDTISNVQGTVLYRDAGSWSALSPGTSGQVLTTGGATANPSWSNGGLLCSLAPSACTSVLGYTSIAWYGAKCDAVYQSGQNGSATNISITSGTPNLTSSGSTFISGDVGKSIWVPNAGAAGVGLSTTISAFVDATHVTLAANASTTVTTFAATNAKPFVYGTNDTTAIQTAMTATPVGGTLFIPGQQTGCLIKKQGANNYALLQDHPFNIRGTGHLSNLMTDPSIASTVDNLLVNVGTYDWAGTTWQGFNIGASPSFLPQTLLMYTRYGKRGLALVDTGSVGFVGITITNMTIGESGNDYSVYLGNPSGINGSQFNVISFSKIWGGIKLDKVEDSHRILYNVLQGFSTFGGLMQFVSGAGGFTFVGNNTTWAGGLKIDGSVKPVINNNYFEELSPTLEVNNAMVDFSGDLFTVVMPSFIGNIVGALYSTTSTPVRYGNSANGNFGDNDITTSTGRTGVISTTTLSCIAPNVWNSVGTHFSTALANTYGGC